VEQPGLLLKISRASFEKPWRQGSDLAFSAALKFDTKIGFHIRKT
jgi:hypothetical protein